VKKLNLMMLCMTFASAAALADTGSYTATLAQPLAAKKSTVANSNIWRCEASTCVLTSEPFEPSSVRSCRALVRQVGAVSAYGSADKMFDSGKLAQCNAH